MENPTFVDKENIPLINQDEYYDNYTPETTPSRVDETSFTVPDASEATSTSRLKQKLKRDKIVPLYRYLGATSDPGLVDLDQFNIKKKKKRLKAGNIELLFLNADRHWQSLTNKRTGEFLAAKTLGEKFGRLNIMKSVLTLDKTPSALKRSVKASTKIKSELPTDLQMQSILRKELSSLVEDIHTKTQEARQNSDLDMTDLEFLGINKALQSIRGELLNNTSKLT